MFRKILTKSAIALLVSVVATAFSAYGDPVPDPSPSKEESAWQTSVVVITVAALVIFGLALWAILRRKRRSEH